jgi:hypothetical protein
MGVGREAESIGMWSKANGDGFPLRFGVAADAKPRFDHRRLNAIVQLCDDD